MSRRSYIRAASFLTALFLVVGGLAVKNGREAAAYRRFLSNSYQHAFAELTAQLDGLDAALQKGQYATSPTLVSALCAEVYGRAAAAQMALGELPYSNVELEQTAAFLAKAGDYAYALSKTAVSAGTPSAQDRETLAGLAAVSADLSARVSSLQEDLNQGDFSLEDVKKAEERLSSMDSGQIKAGSAFQSVEQEFPELPTLIYDGPFSEHLSNRVPRYLEEKPQVDEEAARLAAASFLDRPADSLELVSAGEGVLPTFGFSVSKGEDNLYLEVTRQGGVVVEMLADHQADQAQLLPESALAIAKDFLMERGFSHMSETYFIRQEGMLTVNFAYQDGDVLCYPDLIKVTVALDTGDVIAFEAEGYVMNHASRSLSAPTVDTQTARAVIAADLTVLSHQLTLIPSSGQHELLCHEFKCQAQDGRHILVYVNAQTGQEERILLLLEDENGTLVL